MKTIQKTILMTVALVGWSLMGFAQTNNLVVNGNFTVVGTTTLSNTVTVVGSKALNTGNLVLTNGTANLTGTTVTGLNASQIATGRLSVAIMPTNGVWNATGTVISNATFRGSLTLTNGTANFTGTTITGLNASQITTGRLSATIMPTNGVWNASGMTISNATVTGNGSGLTGITPAQVGAATAAQGALASTALQPTGNGSSLTGITAGQVGSVAANNGVVSNLVMNGSLIFNTGTGIQRVGNVAFQINQNDTDGPVMIERQNGTGGTRNPIFIPSLSLGVWGADYTYRALNFQTLRQTNSDDIAHAIISDGYLSWGTIETRIIG